MPSIITARQTPGTDQMSGLVVVAILIATGLLVFRVTMAFLDRTELSTDEAQYWFWGQEPAFGAYSKPPLIGWIIRVSTDLLGQSVWAVRLPAVLFHAGTAAMIFAVARRFAPEPVSALAALLYLVSPAVALGSAVMTTDTPLLLAAALALLAQLQAGEANAAGRRAPGAAVFLGLALGFGLLAKHAMLFWLSGSLAAALLVPAFRPSRSDAALAVGVFCIVILPHLIWLYRHGFVTLLHVRAITDAADLSVMRPLRYLAEQFLVAGPICFAAIWLAERRHQATRGLAVLALVPLVIVLAQAVKGPVLANWAVLYLVPGTILAAIWLANHPRLALVSLCLGLAVSVALPTIKAFGTDLRRADGRLVLARYLGHSDIARWALATASQEGAEGLVARDRDLLSDLSWVSAGSGLAIRAVPPQGLPRHHWEMTAAFDPDRDGDPLLLLRADAPIPCPDAREVARYPAPPGFAEGDTMVLYRLPDPACLLSPLRKDPQ